MRPLNVWLIGNYPPDGQESMQRFASLLGQELPSLNLNTRLWRPAVKLGRFRTGNPAWDKWPGYVDKFILFPRFLRRQLRSSAPDAIHICDHSNAPYVSAVENFPHLITCNDLLAIRSARGEFPDQPTRWTGRQLQKYILRGLKRARRVVCISQATHDDFRRIVGTPRDGSSVIYMGLNDSYRPLSRAEIHPVLEARRLPESFLLHVGGNQWYKNRLGLLKIYARLLGLRPDAPPLVLVGKPWEASMRRVIAEARIESKVFSLTDCANSELAALYSQAELFLFPSRAEGFGWPILEAMACGCRVMTTGRPPMTEVGGDAAYYLVPEQIDEAAAKVHAVLNQDAAEKSAAAQAGLAQAARFSTTEMLQKYVEIYRETAEC